MLLDCGGVGSVIFLYNGILVLWDDGLGNSASSTE